MVAEKTAVAPAITPAVAQLRGELMTLLAKIEDEDTLAEIQDYLLGLLGHVDMLEDMPPEVLKELEIAIEESYDESDTISNEEAFKLFRQWAKE